MTVAEQDSRADRERWRQRLLIAFRSVGLLDLPNFVNFALRYFEALPDNRRFQAEHPDFIPPPYWRMYEAYGHCSYRGFVDSGSVDAQMVMSMIREYSATLPASVLDWGCGLGRVTQPLKQIGGSDIERLFGTDYNPETVAWCNRSLPGTEFGQNGLEPPFDCESGMFDAVYCISVFTHLSERMHFAWADEITRVLKPGGILIATFHGENYRHKLLANEQARYDKGELIARARVKEGSQLFTAFHPERFLRERLFDGLEVLHTDPNPCPTIAQTLWVVRKPL